MIHADLNSEQDAAMVLLAERAIKASRMALDAMRGHPIDPDAAMALLFEGCAALQVAFPRDIDQQSLRLLLTKTGLGAAYPGRPANDQNPVGAA